MSVARFFVEKTTIAEAIRDQRGDTHPVHTLLGSKEKAQANLSIILNGYRRNG